MPFTVTITTTKPAGATFFREATTAEIRDRLNETIASGQATLTEVDANTRIFALTFATEELMNAWLTGRAEDADWALRTAHNDANSIVDVITHS